MNQCDLAVVVQSGQLLMMNPKHQNGFAKMEGMIPGIVEIVFCSEGFCWGIAHGRKTAKPEVVYCNPQRVEIRTGGSQECVVCCLKILREEHPNVGHWHIRKKLGCRCGRKGYANCNKVVCEEHWATFDHGAP